MPSLVILGAGGFLGRSLISSGLAKLPIKAVVRHHDREIDAVRNEVSWHEADILASHSLDAVFDQGDIVINLAYLPKASEAENINLVDNIIGACLRCGVARLVHCSTAVVAGAAKSTRISELTQCRPITNYERAKWALEQRVLDATPMGLDVGILRPTAVVGPGGKNLLSLINSISSGSPIVNYLRAGLYGKRPMHLVPVGDVVVALFHLATSPRALSGNVYIVSADEDPLNNYQDIEGMILRFLGRAPRKWPLIPFPRLVLSALLKLRGRSETSTNRIYDGEKLREFNCVPNYSLADSVQELVKMYSIKK